MSPLSPGTIAQLACLLEATARKPGNVHPEHAFDDAHYLDFALSALAIRGPLDLAPTRPLGATILDAVRSTRQFINTNTNLGMILLLAPLAAASGEDDLRSGVRRVVEGTTVSDAADVYEAIRLASPGGLGKVEDQDVGQAPTVALLEAMRLASVRDLIARQYVNQYNEIFTLAVPAVRKALRAGYPLETTIQGTFLTLLATHFDSLIWRKCGEATAREATGLARAVMDRGWPDTRAGRESFADLDAWLRAEGHRRNPGTTADLVTAALFVALRDGTIVLPRNAGPRGWSLPELSASDPFDPSPDS